LLAKPMLVTLPFVLLLLDYFPLRRVVGEKEESFADLIKKSVPLAIEKLPFFALTIVSSIVTFIAQKTGGAVQELEVISLSARLGNTVVAYASYLVSMFFPYNLAVFYPYPTGGRPLWQIISALILILGISLAALWTAKTRPYLIFGWLWFLGTLVPVIGLVQVGRQSMADRYTYIPYFGLFVIVIWGASEIIKKFKIPEKAVAGTVALITAILGFLCWQQTSYWKNSDTLFSRTLAVTENNLAINYNYGIYLGKRSNPQRAVTHFAEAIRLDPNFYSALFNMGVSLAAQGKFGEAMNYYNRALEIRPDSAEVYLNVGSALAQQGKFDEAFMNLQKALELDPNNADAQTNIGLVLLQRQRVPEAMRYLRRAVEINPDNAEYHNNLGLGWLVQGSRAEAVKSFGYALQINPGFAKAQANLKRAQETDKPR